MGYAVMVAPAQAEAPQARNGAERQAMNDPTQWDMIAEHEAAQAVVDEIEESDAADLLDELAVEAWIAWRSQVKTGAPTK